MCSYKSLFFIVLLGSTMRAMENDSHVDGATRALKYLSFDASTFNNFTINNKANFAVVVKPQNRNDILGQIMPEEVQFMIPAGSSEHIIFQNSLIVASVLHIDSDAACRISSRKERTLDGKKRYVHDMRVNSNKAGHAEQFFKIIKKIDKS